MARYPHLKPAPEFDPYALKDGAYDITNIVTSAGQDSSAIRVRISNTVLSEIARLVESRQIPDYHTTADVIRDAIVHRLKWLDDNMIQSRTLADTLSVHTLKSRAEERAAILRDRRAAIDALRDNFQIALQERSAYGCQEALEEVRAALDSRESRDDTFKSELEGLAKRMEDEMERLL